ncbi:thiol:disulfide oxidoreductase [Xenorhabdus mauleonii]|uniref:Glutathione S-transferase n=1 Tax=Xenorhabdus mauleonii TaxID=351675 RepID=A0A1I3PEN2_9GAMM|nr:glutathione S-transferase N-terminal domain-containing protein [Xenorhabdus mauleonii]PHM44825.1 thiol:disulfide oxidoreductase [Xenorhabdus mauleonii]SFJ20015.1 Glutathione S-transferase [Xenorhabdus mauleonii]
MIKLYTDSSPNGFKITIALEELELPYELNHVHIDKGENLLPEFLALNPHGRIPVLVDSDTNTTIFESAAILLYLAYKTNKLIPVDHNARWQAIQWLIFHASSVGPIIGQRVNFEFFGSGKNKEATERYKKLTERAFSTMNNHLANNLYFGGEDYSIADIAHFGWTHIAKIINFDFNHYKYLSEWHDRIAARPAVQRGISIPEPATGP